ncbi:eEF1A lysine and N-terminal methyltransferase homolog [Culex pipiens pallens]|uniref:eEF1A lysine and N-terminal methyltransferase homolog n=1 Tax=Culex pipiens pallens TaxID=42434 RepID=UPI0019534997|nr:eEF1A lysine and N-terminal methyltransferase homolog [Culex pipiens pallens]
MNLLPKTATEFGTTEYWNNFFKKRGKQAFEWYGEYPELCGQLHKYIKTKDEVLMVGCGNSKLSMDLYDVGFRQITNIDISQVVIKQMQDANRTTRPEMLWYHMDATAMTAFSDEKYSVVLDKGTLDALFTDETEETIATVRKYFSEIARVLRVGGRYVCISLLQEHILKEVLSFFPEHEFMFRAIRCVEAEQKTAEGNSDGTSMPVFVVVATKFRKLPMKVYEVCLAGDEIQRVQKPEEIVLSVAAAQKASMVCNGLVRGSIAGMSEVSLDLHRPGEEIARYTIHVLDQKPIRGNGKYAAFIVPQGRETEWLFSTPQGRQKLLASASHDRLAIVSLHRGQVYASWDAVKDELAESVKSLAPHGLHAHIPYLSLGSEVGQRETIFKGHSTMSGDYIVEEILGNDNRIFRRLIFLNNQFVIQSEAAVKLVKGKGKSKTSSKVVDPGYLACQHHLYMTVGVHLATCLATGQAANPVMVVGLGGGGLCTFIHQCLRNTSLVAVEIDPEMLTVATSYFGLALDDRLAVQIRDGIDYLADCVQSSQRFRAILFDVDSKDPTLGMSCPPQAFVERAVLDNAKTLLGADGLFILNLVCRDETLRESVLRELRRVFRYVLSYKLEEDVNEIFYCADNAALDSADKWQEAMKRSAQEINALAKKHKLSREELVDLEEFVQALKI